MRFGTIPLSLKLLDWLLQNEDLTRVFLGATGADPSQLRAQIEDPELLAAVIDFILMDDQWVLAAAAHAGIPPQEVPALRAQLPGGATPDWT